MTEPKAANGAAPDTADLFLPALREALGAPPVWEKRVLEIGLVWPELPGDHAGREAELGDRVNRRWAAERLRVFLLTWDPFEWQPARPAAFATSTSRADGVGLVLYAPHWQALAAAGGRPEGVAAVLGRLAESVVSVAGEYRAAITDGSYPAAVQSGARPRLLSRIPDQPALEPPALSVVGDGWRPLEFDALEDLAQDGFGPADLDRSPVHFSQRGEGRSGCPGCAGEAVGFPEGLKDAQEAICGPHRAEALRITTARLEASKASNPAGWEALLDAGQRLMEPHLPNGLGPRLVAAALVEAPTPGQLRDHAAMVVGAARLMAGLPDPQTALGGRIERVRPWLQQLPAQLSGAGLADEAAEVEPAVDELLSASSAVAAAAAAAVAADASGAAGDAGGPKAQPYVREVRVGRNAPCPCGSGKKYKFCHGTGRPTST